MSLLDIEGMSAYQPSSRTYDRNHPYAYIHPTLSEILIFEEPLSTGAYDGANPGIYQHPTLVTEEEGEYSGVYDWKRPGRIMLPREVFIHGVQSLATEVKKERTQRHLRINSKRKTPHIA